MCPTRSPQQQGANQIASETSTKRRALFIPGYAAGAAAYFNIFKGLLEIYDEIVTIDVLGFGCSGRPDFYAFDTKECNDFFILQLQMWMKKTGYDSADKGKFTIIGHSLGCYIGTHYAIAEPDKIDEMIHLSPAAIGEKPQDYRPYEYVEKQTNFGKRILMNIAYLFWDFNLSPMIPFKMFGYWPGRYLQKGWLQRIKNPSEHDKEVLSQFMMQAGLRKTSTDKCVTVIFSFGHGWARLPLA